MVLSCKGRRVEDGRGEEVLGGSWVVLHEDALSVGVSDGSVSVGVDVGVHEDEDEEGKEMEDTPKEHCSQQLTPQEEAHTDSTEVEDSAFLS